AIRRRTRRTIRNDAGAACASAVVALRLPRLESVCDPKRPFRRRRPACRSCCSVERANSIRQRLRPALLNQTIAHVALVVRDYDEAIDYYTRVMGFELLEDTALGPGKRWVLVAPRGGGASLLLAKAANDEQASRIGNQTGGRVFLFLHTDDFA